MSSVPGPPSKPPRSVLTVRDMLVAIGVLVAVVLVLGGLAGSWSFAPTGPTVDSSGLPTVDAPAELRGLAAAVPFPVRVPAVPAGWKANSTGRQATPDGGTSVRVGYLTPDGQYMRLLQSDAGEEALLAAEAGPQAPVGQGVVDVGGQQWVTFSGTDERGEPIWVTEVTAPNAPPVRMLISGSGSEDEMRALATAAVTGQVLPLGTAPPR